MQPKPLAVFDLCGTLTPYNTTFGFYAYLAPHKSRLLFSKPSRVLARIIELLTGSNPIRSIVIASLKGRSIADMTHWARCYLHDVILPSMRAKVVQQLECHRATHRVILVSAAIEPVVKAVAEHLGVIYLASQLAVEKNGILQGKLARDLYGRKELLLAGENIDLVVTDSRSDVGLMSLSRRAIFIDNKSRRRLPLRWLYSVETSVEVWGFE